ncbi:hypothetical protein ACB092_01G331100 [Castanea dentata]
MALVTTNMFHSGIRAGVLAFLELVQDMLHPDQPSSSKKKKALTKAAIESMPRVTITAKEDCSICLEGFKFGVSKEEKAEEDCSVCLEEFDTGSEVREMTCKHRFHSVCIERWLQVRGSCPLCRFVVPKITDSGRGGGSNPSSE